MEWASGFSVVLCNIIFSDQNVAVTPGPSAEEGIKKTWRCVHIQCHSAFGRGQIQHLLHSGRIFRTLCYVKYTTPKEQLSMCDSHSASCQTHQDRMEVSRAPGRGKRECSMGAELPYEVTGKFWRWIMGRAMSHCECRKFSYLHPLKELKWQILCYVYFTRNFLKKCQLVS